MYVCMYACMYVYMYVHQCVYVLCIFYLGMTDPLENVQHLYIRAGFITVFNRIPIMVTYKDSNILN